jgi:hypothetical protein
VKWAQLIPAESHDVLLIRLGAMVCLGLAGNGTARFSNWKPLRSPFSQGSGPRPPPLVGRVEHQLRSHFSRGQPPWQALRPRAVHKDCVGWILKRATHGLSSNCRTEAAVCLTTVRQPKSYDFRLFI